MTLLSKTYWAGPPFRFVEAPPDTDATPLVLRAVDGREAAAIYWTPRHRPKPRVAVICMHPRVDFTRHYLFPGLLAAGVACLGANTRAPNNDVDTVHEELLLDVDAAMTFLREQHEVEHVVLLGNSGGGSLLAYYQAQARKAPGDRVSRTPAGRRTRLGGAPLIPADGMIYVAAHPGQGHILAGCIDPALLDEGDPVASDTSLDMYAAANGFVEPPTWTEYDADFVARYRRAQRDRVQRLDALARAWIERSRDAARHARGDEFAALSFAERQAVERIQHTEPVMVIYRTMANLHYADRRLDPSERSYGSILSERPDLMNQKLFGFARLCTPRAWLSTWSVHASRADFCANVAEIAEPTLLVSAGKDREIYPATHTRPMVAAIAAPDMTAHEIEGAGHYFEPQLASAGGGSGAAPHRAELLRIIVGWLADRYDGSLQVA